MNSGKAKRIRKKVYGEISSKNPQYEERDDAPVRLIKVHGKLRKVKTSIIICTGLRAEYLKAKKGAV